VAGHPGRVSPGAAAHDGAADGGFAMDARYGHDFIQELVFFGPGGLPIPLPLDRGVLAKAGSRHGTLLSWIGNRDF
jgi:hypothetical protein